MHELLLLFGFTCAPVVVVELVDEGFVDVVHDGVEGVHGVLVNLAEQNLIVVGSTRGDRFSSRDSASQEVNTLAFKLFLLT